MRTKTLLLTAALAAAGAATAMAQSTIYSVNAVGYANKSVPAGFSIIANPFEQTSGDYSLNTLLPPGNPNLQDAAMYVFADGRFLPPMSYDETDGWDCGVNCASANLPLGGGAFLLSPRATTVTFVGQVKQSVGGAPVVNNVNAGFSIRSSAIPQMGTLNGLELWGLPDDSALYHFNSAASPQRYDPPASYNSTDRWDADYVLDIGEGFFLLSPSAGAISRVFNVN
jgi:hypothetical protein